MQLVPFEFIADFIKNTSLVITNPDTYLKAVTEPWFYQVIYNILLFVPFGLYLRYYFKCSFLKTLILSFLLSLFFELTQLSGLYGYYSRSYRLFDVDDLMINTLGGVVGFLVAGFVLKILPNRDELDSYAYKKGQMITVWRRLVNFMLDLFLYGILTGFLYSFVREPFGVSIVKVIPLLSGMVYYIIIPIIFNGQTLGKRFLKMKLVNLKEEKPKFYQYVFRYGLLFFILIPFPAYLVYISTYLLNNFSNDIAGFLEAILFAILLLGTFIYYLVMIIFMAKGKLLWYENLSRTKNVSTIKATLETEKPAETEDLHKNE